MKASTTKLLRVGVFGAPGSYSEEAALAYARREGLGVELEHRSAMDQLLADVEAARVQLAVLPIHNSVGGLVRGSFEALGAAHFEPIGQVTIDIRHCVLVASPAVAASTIDAVASHPQALLQCARYLERELSGRRRVESNDTATAARDLASGRLDARTAVIASRRAAETCGLHVLAADVQDDPENRTAFLVLGGRR